MHNPETSILDSPTHVNIFACSRPEWKMAAVDLHGGVDDGPGGRGDGGRVHRGFPSKQLNRGRCPWVLCEPGQNVSCNHMPNLC